jgi:hypothetical protein
MLHAFSFGNYGQFVGVEQFRRRLPVGFDRGASALGYVQSRLTYVMAFADRVQSQYLKFPITALIRHYRGSRPILAKTWSSSRRHPASKVLAKVIDEHDVAVYIFL